MNNPISDPLAAYMAGLLEGDACIWFRKDNKGVPKNVLIKYTFHRDDKPFVEFLRDLFNIGVVRELSDSKVVNWEILKISEVLSFLSFINGYLRTAKYETLRQAFEIYRIHHNIDVPLKPLNTSPILSDAWLAGFSDADSYFYVQIYKGKSLNIKTYYVLHVAKNYIIKKVEYDYLRDNTIFMGPLSKIFNVPLESSKKKPLPGYTTETYSLKIRVYRSTDIPILIEYFNKYPLFSSKYHNYMDWKAIIELKMNSKAQGIKLSTIEEKISSIKNKMNSERDPNTITWDHLSNFHKCSF